MKNSRRKSLELKRRGITLSSEIQVKVWTEKATLITTDLKKIESFLRKIGSKTYFVYLLKNEDVILIGCSE